MRRAPAPHRLPDLLPEIRRRPRLACPHRFRAIPQERLRAGPHDVRHRRVISKERFRPLLNVKRRRQSRRIQAPIIKKRTVLAEGVLVGRVIDRAFLIAQKQQQARLDRVSQRLPTPRINLAGEQWFCDLHAFH